MTPRILARHRRTRTFDRYGANAWWRKVAVAERLDPDRAWNLARWMARDVDPSTAWRTAVEHLVLLLACVTSFVVGLTLPPVPWWLR